MRIIDRIRHRVSRNKVRRHNALVLAKALTDAGVRRTNTISYDAWQIAMTEAGISHLPSPETQRLVRKMLPK